MKLRTNVFDLWVFLRGSDEPRYLLLRTSQQKADKWFGGGRFWQIPGGFCEEGELIIDAIHRILVMHGLSSDSFWAIEHTYTCYNRRRQNLEIIPVFAAEVQEIIEIPLSWEHSEYQWATASECMDLLEFRGLLEGLAWTQKYVSERDKPSELFLLDLTK